MNIGVIPMIAEVGGTTGLVAFDATMVMQIVNTVVLFLLLRHFLFEPVSQFMQKREQHIAGEYERVQTLQDDADELKKQYDQKMLEIEEKGSQIIKEASNKAEEKAKQIIKEAEVEVANMKQKANADIEQEQVKAMNELKDEIASMAVLAASKIISTDIKVDGHRQLVSQIIDEMGDAKWQN